MDLKCNGYESALDGYKDIFSKLIDPEYSEKAFEVLQMFYDKGQVLSIKDEGHDF